jgi:membrane peptidoglycan carboxypeptidase
MAQVGFLSPHQARAAMKEPVRLAYTEPPRLTVRRAGYFVDYVVRQLEDRYGAEMLFRGGLKVQTTLNTRAQEAAERAVANGMNGRFGRRSRTQAALVSIDPTNGYIRAMVGGRSYARSVFNRAAQAKRQPGSSFKPFVYAAAMGSGYTPMDRITDAPVHFAGMDWHPKNYDGRWHGTMTLTQAFAQSVNIPAIKLLNSVGPGNVIKLARACGIESPLGDNLSLALGTSEVSVLEIAGAYGAFATGGDYTPPIAIVRVRDGKGRLLESNYPNPETVLDEMVARRMDFLLRKVVRVGTGRPAASVPDARGKTGTTNDLKDAWFVGYTPSLVTAVWVGNDHPSRIPGLTGGGACAPIWVAYMQRALRILPSHPLPDALRMPAPPQDRIYVAEDGQAPGRTVAVAGTAGATAPDEVASDEANYNAVSSNAASGAAMSSSDTVPPDAVRRRVCLVTGQLATRNCPETDVESFARGTEPTEFCTLHGGRTMVGAMTAGEVVVLCRASGGLAGPNCTDLVTMRLRAGARLPGSCRIHSRPAAREAAALATLPFPGQ